MAMAKKRIAVELKDVVEKPLPGVMVQAGEESADDALSQWEVIINGPEGSPYEGGSFRWLVFFPKTYPFHPPSLLLKTEIYHCNLSPLVTRSAQYYLRVGEDWHPKMRMKDIFLNILDVMAEPIDVLAKPDARWVLSHEPGLTFDPPRCTGNGIRAQVKSLTGKTLSIEAGPYDLIDSLKLEINLQEGIPWGEINLCAVGKSLENGRTFADYFGVEHGQEVTVHMVFGNMVARQRIGDTPHPELAGLFHADRKAFEAYACECTARHAMTETLRMATVATSPESSEITCRACLSGEPLLILQNSSTESICVGDVRKALANELKVDSCLLALVTEDGRLLSLHDDLRTVAEAVAIPEEDVDASVSHPESYACAEPEPSLP